MGLALYRKYRSKSLDEIVGQSHITDILRRAIKSGNIAHAYLLTGPKGVGKTSIARILAHEINKLPYTDESTHLDIIEIDAASNNSVEDIRDLRERVQIAPTSAAKKVYIIDEVHMLSKSAFNALLKTLEEPPEHVVFILATTDVDKLPATIISRTQRFNFRAISVDDAVNHLTDIAKKEKISADAEALRLIAEHSMGSFRDSISMLDQLQHAEGGKITIEAVERVMGLAPRQVVLELLEAYKTQNIPHIVETLNSYERRGIPASTLTRQLIAYIHQQVVSDPSLLTLLDALLDTTRTAWPYVKLLTALARPTSTLPTITPASATPVRPAKSPKPVAPVTPEPANEPQAPDPAPAAKEPVAVSKPSEAFAWEQFLVPIKEKSSGTFTILQKCGYNFDGTTLTIYANKKFNKTQIEKTIATLNHALALVAPQAKELIILPSPKPSENSQTAAVLDIMGGGEEVSI